MFTPLEEGVDHVRGPAGAPVVLEYRDAAAAAEAAALQGPLGKCTNCSSTGGYDTDSLLQALTSVSA